MNELYNTLGVDKDASAEDIKKSYRKLAVENHPDKEGGNSEKMKEVTSAYNILKDPAKRERYDNTGETNSEESFESRFRTMLNNVFGAIIDTEKDVEGTDLVDILRGELKNQERLQRDSLTSLRLEIERLEKVLSRIKKDDGLMKPLVEAKIESVRRAIGFTENNIEFISASIKRCDNYEYEVDEQKEGYLDEENDFIRKYFVKF
jgi:curved DNA-binding protein CbpA